jgi:phage terminase large subunit-like protein
MRKSCIDGTSYDTGWAEWSVDEEPKDLMDPTLWYQTNPSMGHHLDERKIRAEYDPRNPLDFIIQRLGYWYQYSLKSAITEKEWRQSEVQKRPDLEKNRYFGVKFGHDGTNGVLSVASKTTDGKIFIEAIDCRPVRWGIDWMIPFLENPNCSGVVVDGDNGKHMLIDMMKQSDIKAPVVPTVQEIITANEKFEHAVFTGAIQHIDQEALRNAVSNCTHRNIGNKGGFGYKSLDEAYEVSLVESVALAYWLCLESKETTVQAVYL